MVGGERPGALGLCLRGTCFSPEGELSWTGLLTRKCLWEEDRKLVAAHWRNSRLVRLRRDRFLHHLCSAFTSNHRISCLPLLIIFPSISYLLVASWVGKWPFLRTTQRKGVLLPFLLIILLVLIIAAMVFYPRSRSVNHDRMKKSKKCWIFLSLLFSFVFF